MNVRLLGVAAALVLSVGCYRQEFSTGLASAGSPQVEKVPFYLWGIIGDNTVDLDKICPNGVANFSNHVTFGNGCVGAITCGIYMPETVEVTCGGGTSYLLTPDEEHGITRVEQVAVGGDK